MSRFFFRDIHSHKIGYVKTPRRSAAPTPPVMLQIANGTAEPSEGSPPASMPPLGSHGNYVNAVPIAFAPPGFHSAPVKTEAVAPGAPMGYSPSSSPNVQTMQVNQTKSPSMAPGTDSVETRKRRNDDATMTVASKKKATQDLVGSSSATDQVSTEYRQPPCCSSLLVPCWCTYFVALILMQSVYVVLIFWTKQVSKYMGERELKEFKFMKLENRMLREE